MAPGGLENSARAQGALEQHLQPAVPLYYHRRFSPLTSKSVAMLKASGGLGLLGWGATKQTQSWRNTSKSNLIVYDVVYDIVCIYECYIACDIAYDIVYSLPGGSSLGSDAWADQWVAQRLGPAIEKLALPLNGSKGAEVTLGAKNEVVL